MIYWIKRKIWQIRNVFKWLPIIWNQYDFDYKYAIDVFKFQLQKTSNFLNSDRAYSISAKDNHKRLEMIIRLMDKVYEDEYSMECFTELEKLYGPDVLGVNFVPCDDNPNYSYMKYNYELNETPEKIKEISDKQSELFKKSALKQKRAHKLLWDLIEHNIQSMWD